MNVYTQGSRAHALQAAINANLDRLGELSDWLTELGLYQEHPVTGEIVLEDLRTVAPRVADEIHNLNAARRQLYERLEDACNPWT